ncbi:MAG: ribosomal protein S18-alanine N-acetyltransferase [Armatimonadota bacterium]
MTSGCGNAEWRASVTIEPMQRRDVETVREIDHLSFPSSWSAESYLRDLRNRSSFYIVARLSGEVIGYAGMWLIADEAHISTLAVHPDRRRCGIGQRLLTHLIAVARDRGAAEITLEVREANIAARALYGKFGFMSKGLIPNYYGDTGENAIVMSLGRGNAEPVEEWPE